jgi:nucleoside-diphosphate-sugar epimerase
MKNVLVAGGAGMIGSHLVDALLPRVDRVTVVDNFVTGQAVNLAHLGQEPRLTIIDADVSEPLPPSVTAALFDRVYHLASPASRSISCVDVWRSCSSTRPARTISWR